MAKLALLSAISGPTIGALLLYQFGYWLSDHWTGAKTGMEGAPAGWANIAFVYYALFLAAPGAAAFGALGSWLLIRSRDAGASRAVLYRYGALLGVAFGWLCLPISVLILAIPFIWIFHAGTPERPVGFLCGSTHAILL